ncbi:MAG: DUF3800 domain-containing protein, partial [Methanobacterium sp.]
MYLCYIDESGTPELTGNTSHFILAGISIPIWHWQNYEKEIKAIQNKYELNGTEIHTAWILRPYREQSLIPNFEIMHNTQRRTEIESYRKGELLRLQRVNDSNRYNQVKKNYAKTTPYVHLTQIERKAYINDLAKCIANWQSARLFAECIDKVYFDPVKTKQTTDEQAFEQLVSRFEQFLERTNKKKTDGCYGLLIYDNNVTVAKKHTELMHRFRLSGTLWTKIDRIIETPLFVNSELTSMIQIADVCAYSLRRYLENDEEELFNCIFKRADTVSSGK